MRRTPGGLATEAAVVRLADRLLVESGRALVGPKQARRLANVSRATLERAYVTGALVVSRPGGRLVVISVFRLAEWIVRCERARR